MANGITTRVPFPLAHRISQRGVRFDAISCHETTPTSLSQFAHRCRICCNVRYSSLGPKRETRAKDLGSRTVATFFACTIPLCAEDFKSQHEEFMRSEHSLHQFLVWFLPIFHALRFANCGSQQFFSVITLIFDKFWNTLAPLQPTFALFSGSQSPVLCVVAFNSRIFTLRNLHTYEYTEKYSRCRSIGRNRKLPSAYWRPYTVHLARNLYVQKPAFLSFHWNFKVNSCFSLELPLAYFVLFQVNENKSCTDENSSRVNF